MVLHVGSSPTRALNRKVTQLLMKTNTERIILGTLVLHNSNLVVQHRRSPKSKFGWTVDPQVHILSRNDTVLERSVQEHLRYFRIDFTTQKRGLITIVTSFNDLMHLKNEMDVLTTTQSGFFPREWLKKWGTFYRVVSMYGADMHHQRETFLKIIDLRVSFMEKAMGKIEFMEKHCGEVA